ncbi:MAG: hypothetical protein Q9M43_11875 [Sulfurimonas sp.]|nr:hypothetical protein [Sulfurimonas sp.]
MKNLPDGMDTKAFMYHYETRYSVMTALKEKDILVPFEFDYSKKEFRKYFDIMAEKKHKKAYALFYSKLEEKIGKNDIKLSMDWEAFMHSDYIHAQIQEKLKIRDADTIENIVSALYSKDLANFRELVYLPKISEKIEKMNFKREDFLDGAQASSYGDDAIKLLYIPPFALSISMISLLLNVITVFAMFLTLVNIPRVIGNTLKIILVTLMVAVPIYYKAQTVNTNLLHQTSTKGKIYLNFMAWISYYEKQNYLLHEKKILPDATRFL